MDKTPDPMAQIEAALDYFAMCERAMQITSMEESCFLARANELSGARTALLALIRRALSPQPGQVDDEAQHKSMMRALKGYKRGYEDGKEHPPTPAHDEAGVRAALMAFADFLHQLSDENGYEVGPMRIKYENGQAVDGPWWVGQDDTRRWVDLFLAEKK